MEITRVNKNYEGDIFFPEVDWSKWTLINKEDNFSDESDYSFLSYVKKII